MTRRWLPQLSVPVLAVAVALGAASCTSESSGPPDGVSRSPGPPTPPAGRPVVDLTFRMADDLTSAQGTEHVEFTPSQQVCELVFRAWPNKPTTARTGNRLTVDSITVDGTKLPLQVSSAGASRSAPGTLVTAALPSCRPAGTKIAADLAFDVRLGSRTDERVGYSPRSSIAWLGSAYPTLAWTRADGWVRDDAVDVVGETTTNEAFELRSLEVEAPSTYAVAGIGEPDEPRPTAGGRTTHRFTAEVVRDVTVTVGEIDVTTTQVDGLTVSVALPRSGARADAAAWDHETRRALANLSKLLGPIPADHIWMSVLPNVSEGVEFGSAVQIGDVDPVKERWLVVHELAHLWFYGLVGNNQARDPWLDESFATYAQEVVDPSGTTKDRAQAVQGAVGRSMAQWATTRRSDAAYVDTVYGAGGKALLEARDAAGADAFDEAIRGYVRDRAWQIATPADVSKALTGLPAAIDVLRTAGALR